MADEMEDRRFYHWLGKRDGYADVLMLAASKGERHALREIAQTLVDWEPEHPNCWAVDYLEQTKEQEPCAATHPSHGANS